MSHQSLNPATEKILKSFAEISALADRANSATALLDAGERVDADEMGEGV
jgi:hypothetical protein